jgi:hypothetical protein
MTLQGTHGSQKNQQTNSFQQGKQYTLTARQSNTCLMRMLSMRWT